MKKNKNNFYYEERYAVIVKGYEGDEYWLLPNFGYVLKIVDSFDEGWKYIDNEFTVADLCDESDALYCLRFEVIKQRRRYEKYYGKKLYDYSEEWKDKYESIL